jgi:C4-dicarboxylate-specific signal transduction histidine kinase
VNAVEEDRATPRIRTLAKHLADMVQGFASLIRRTGIAKDKASSMIRRAKENLELRLRVHKIEATITTTHDFSVRCTVRLIISTIMNLIDNSIYWLDSIPPVHDTKKRIYLGTTNELSGGPAIVIADNGPGFLDPPEYLIEPFITRKPDGMGLGLHIANEVMKANKGTLEFPEPGDLELPPNMTGAVVALIFRGEKQ